MARPCSRGPGGTSGCCVRLRAGTRTPGTVPGRAPGTVQSGPRDSAGADHQAPPGSGQRSPGPPAVPGIGLRHSAPFRFGRVPPDVRSDLVISVFSLTAVVRRERPLIPVGSRRGGVPGWRLRASPRPGPMDPGCMNPAIHPGFASTTPRGGSLPLSGRHRPWPDRDRKAYGHGERTCGLRRNGVRAVRRCAAAVDGVARAAPRAGGTGCEPHRFRHSRHCVRRTFSRPRCVVLHPHLNPPPPDPAGSRGARWAAPGNTPGPTALHHLRPRRRHSNQKPAGSGRARGGPGSPGGRNGGSRVTVRVAVAGFCRLTRGRVVPSHSAATAPSAASSRCPDAH